MRGYNMLEMMHPLLLPSEPYVKLVELASANFPRRGGGGGNRGSADGAQPSEPSSVTSSFLKAKCWFFLLVGGYSDKVSQTNLSLDRG